MFGVTRSTLVVLSAASFSEHLCAVLNEFATVLLVLADRAFGAMPSEHRVIVYTVRSNNTP